MHRIAIENFDDYLTESLIENCDSYEENQKSWSSEKGSGTVNEVPIRPGLTLLIEKFDFNEPVEAAMDVQPSPIEIFFCVSGEVRGHARELGKNILIEEGKASFFFAPHLSCAPTISAEAPLKLITIRFAPEILCQEVKGLAEIFPHQVMDPSALTFDSSILCSPTMTSEMKMAIIQILSCPYTGAFRRVYLESKSTELIVLFFASIQNDQHDFQFNSSTLSPSEITKIHQARTILSKDFENPPNLGEIAREVGMNKDKLNQGFHKLFGTSVFGCFRQQKMEVAKRLLEDREMNVTEVAYSLGYSQPGTFSRAFKQYYGINPKAYHQRIAAEV